MTAGATEADREARATPALDGLITDDQGPQVANADDPAGILRSGLLAGLDPGGLADRFGTPLYVYDLDLVDRQVDRLRAVLPEPVELAYALKANPSLAVVAHLGRRGLGADIASAGELATALRAGIAPGSIVFTGPGKGEAELALAVERGIRAVTVESPAELERLERIAAAAGRRVPVLLRAAVSDPARHEVVRLIGDEGAGKFGMDRSDLRHAARRAARSEHLELLGLHAFGASNVREADVLAEHVAATVALAVEVTREAGLPLRLVDAGGGLGIPYRADEAPLDLAALGARLTAQADRWRREPATRPMRLLLEPGRFLVGPAGAYLARVVDRKTVDGQAVAILDGGIHHLLRPALVGQEQRIHVFTLTPGGGGPLPAGEAAGSVTIAGPLCSGLDVLSRGAVTAHPAVGDLVAVLDAGAYGFTEAMPFFLSHPIPAEVVVVGGRAELVRPRLEPETWLGWQRDPGL